MSHSSEHTESSTTKRPPARTAAEADETEECSEGRVDPRHLFHHVREGFADMMYKQLNGWVMGATTFLAEREKAHSAEKAEAGHTLHHLNAAYRQYHSHKTQAKADFVDHVLSYKKHKPRGKK